MNRNIILIALLCLLSIGRTVAQSVTVEAKDRFVADINWRTGESTITSSDGRQTTCCFFLLIPIHWCEG